MENKNRFRTYKRAVHIIEKVVNVATAISMLAIVIAILLQVFFRYVLNNSLIWSEEMARYMGIFNTMLCLGYCVRHRRHIMIDIAVSWIKGTAGKVVKVIQNLISVAVFGYCTVFSYKFMLMAEGISSPALHWPMMFVYGVVFVGLLNATILSGCSVVDVIFDIDPSDDGKADVSVKA